METKNLTIIRANGIDHLCWRNGDKYVDVSNPMLVFAPEDVFEIILVDPAYWENIYEYKGLKVRLRPQIYVNGWLALYLEPVAAKRDFFVLTKNLEQMSALGLPNHAYVDINNEPEALQFLVSNGLATQTSSVRRNGSINYPMVRLNLPLIYQHNPTVFGNINL